MKGFLVLVLFTAAGLAGVLYFRKVVQAPKTPVVAAAPEPSKDSKQHRVRRRHGARRLPHKAVPLSAASAEAPPSEGPSAVGTFGAPSGPDDRAALPGGSSVSEVPPEDVLGLAGSAPTLAPSRPTEAPEPDEPPPVKLKPADLRMVWQGQDLSKAETMRLDLSSDVGGHDLTDDEIDAKFRTKEDAVLACIARARPNESTFVPGHVTVRFRIERTGAVKGVQVEAPVILHKGGLTGCVRGVVSSLRYPASNMGQVVSFPFSLS